MNTLDFNLKNINVKEFVASVSKGDSTGFINESGVYPVKIKYVRSFENNSGSKSFSVVCSLEGSDKETIVYGSVFQKSTGEKNEIGFNQLISLQAVCGIDSLTQATKKVKSFKDNEELEITVFKEFEDKKVIIQVTKEFSKYNDKINSKIAFRDAFRTNDNANAAEILFKKDFGKKMKWLKDNESKVKAIRYDGVTEQEVKAWLESRKSGKDVVEQITGGDSNEETPF